MASLRYGGLHPRERNLRDRDWLELITIYAAENEAIRKGR